MDSSIYLEWYDKTFIPETKNFKKKTGKKAKLILVIDNAPMQPSPELVVREEYKFKCVSLLPNVKGLLQPMNQDVVKSTKPVYRQQLVSKLLLAEENNKERVFGSLQENQLERLLLYDCRFLEHS